MLALVSVLLAVLSYRFVEQPFRTRRWQPAQNVWAGLAACMLIFCASMYIDSSNGLPARVPREAYADRSLEAMWAWPCKEMPLSPGGKPYCVFGAPWEDGVEKAVLWGDSHAEHLAPLLKAGATRANVAVALYTRCPAAVGTAILGARAGHIYNEECEASRAALFALLAQQPEIKTVILSAAWPAVDQPVAGRWASVPGDQQGKIAGDRADGCHQPTIGVEPESCSCCYRAALVSLVCPLRTLRQGVVPQAMRGAGDVSEKITISGNARGKPAGVSAHRGGSSGRTADRSRRRHVPRGKLHHGAGWRRPLSRHQPSSPQPARDDKCRACPAAGTLTRLFTR